MSPSLVPRLLALLTACILTGCHTRPEDVSGTYPANSVSAVDAGGSTIQNGSRGHIGDMRVLPVANYVRPSIPLTYGPDVMSIWVFPCVSRDGMSWREGFWIHHVLRTFSWGMERAMAGSQPLAAGTDMSGRPLSMTAADQSPVEPQSSFLQGAKNTWGNYQAPWVEQPGSPLSTPGGQTQPVKQSK